MKNFINFIFAKDFREHKSKENMVDNYLAYMGETVNAYEIFVSQLEWKDITKNCIWRLAEIRPQCQA